MNEMNVKNHFEKTRDYIEIRKKIFMQNDFKIEREFYEDKIMNEKKLHPLASIGLFMPHLDSYCQNMRVIQNDHLSGEKREAPSIMEQPSSGETSLCDLDIESDSRSPSAKLSCQKLCDIYVDTRQMKLDERQPEKVRPKEKVSKEWSGIRELLIVGFDESRLFERNNIEELIKNNFLNVRFIEIDKTQFIYYEGKLSLMIKFQTEIAA